MAKKLMKGAEAIGEAAIRAGAINYFCYPITPQTEVAEYLSKRMPAVGGVFLQAESELAASQMIFGAAGAGVRAFTSSSSPGISLMAEAISYIAGAQLPSVFVNVVRAGPGLGGILPAQSDYFQATKGGGHGDYRCLVLSPCTVQEAVELTVLAFELADRYRNPVMIMTDGNLGQMMEPVDLDIVDPGPPPPDKEVWATTGCQGRKRNLIKTLYLDPYALDDLNRVLQEKYRQMEEREVRYDHYLLEDSPRLVIVAYGTMARVARTAVDILRSQGVEAAVFRPISLYPFPTKKVYEIAQQEGVEVMMSLEMSMGQMVEDVERAVVGKVPVRFYGRAGGVVPSPEEVVEAAKRVLATELV